MRFVNLLLVLIAGLSTTSGTYAQQPVNVQDSLALVDFYNSTNGPGWYSNGTWNQGPVNTWWYGIGITGTRVTELTIPENNLKGPVPASFGNLTELKRLSLFDNHLTSLPSSFGNLTKLEFIDLDANAISSLPASFGNLSNLKTLYFNNNQLTALPESFGNLTNLDYLGLATNQLTSLPQSFGSLTNLKTLYLLQNQLSSLPQSFGNLNALQVLYLGFNQLTSLPDFLGKLSNLRTLSLIGNQLSSLPKSLGNLTNLEGLVISYNKFTFGELERLLETFPSIQFFTYAPQDTFKLAKNGNTLIAAVGGTPQNNTFYWYRDDVLVTTIEEDSTYTPTQPGNYRAEVTNAVATQLRLKSDVVAFGPGNIMLTCPPDTIVTTDSSLCTVVVSGIDPMVTGATMVDVSYTLSGATTGSGTGTASGRAFNNGLTTVTYTLSSDASVNCDFTVMVEDKEAPLITTVSATPSVLWPANHKLQDVVVNYNVGDNCGSTIELSVSGNDGATNDDWQVVDAHHVQLRAERSGRGEGRTYVITIMATDASGNKSSQSVKVMVPHDRSKKFNSDLQVLVLPNPSRNDFTLRLQNSRQLPVMVRVINAVGETIETIQNTTTKGSLRLGSNYPVGTYYAEVIQGNTRTVVKLMKLAR